MTPESAAEMYEERAAILEYCGGWPREKAEALAKAELQTYLDQLAAEKMK